MYHPVLSVEIFSILEQIVYSLTTQTQQIVNPLSKPPETTLTLFLHVLYLLLFVYSFYDAAGC